MTDLDSRQLSLLGTADDVDVFADYRENVANKGLIRYKTVFQHGNKQGESLWTHVVNMVAVLDALQPLVSLDETETRILFTAITTHDINKMREEHKSFSNLAQQPTIAEVIEEIGFDDFFPEWRIYLADFEALIRAHPGHFPVDGDSLVVKHDRYRLGRDRVQALKHLIRAVDIIDLSHTLDERAHKNTFLGHLNTYLNVSGDSRQFVFFTHQVVEQRGLLTNVIHNALMEALVEQYGLVPLLLYPDGVAYLVERALDIQPDEANVVALGKKLTSRIEGIVVRDVSNLVDMPASGCKIKPDAFEVGASWADLWQEAHNQISRRTFKPTEYNENARAGTYQEALKKQGKQPEYGKVLLERLADPALIVQATNDQFRAAELARAYYLFLKTDFKGVSKRRVDDPWRYIYALIDLPQEKWDFYDYFNPSFHRLYVIAGDIPLSEDAVFDRLLADGEPILADAKPAGETESGLWVQYIKHYVLVNGEPLAQEGWGGHLAHYVTNQHKQCVYCSGPFETVEWMKADVRDGIKVQQFSYRLEGGSKREPKKFICEVCRIQFLLEVLNYPSVRGENTLYLHLFPYSFYPAPFIQGLKSTLHRLRSSDFAVQALHMDTPAAIDELVVKNTVSPVFQAETKDGRPHPYGLYVPHY